MAPPEAARVCEYAVPTVPLGSDVVVISSAGALMVRLKAWLAVALAVSLTWAVKLNEPAVVGVPVIAPVDELSESPAGRELAEIDQP